MHTDAQGAVYRELARQYDADVRAYSSYGHAVLFGMGFEFVGKGETLLDIGIGTGLASIPFAKIGLNVYGLDASPDMLAVCRSKSFARDLKQWDIDRLPLPYADHFFHHVICCGVLHFTGDLAGLFSEVRRVTQKDGIFGFTIAPHDATADYQKEPSAWGVPIFRHAPHYILELLKTNGMALLKEQRLLVKGADKSHYDMLFSALIARCR